MAEPGATEAITSPDVRITERVANLTHVAKSGQQRIIELTGGAVGLRDSGALDSAIGSAFQTFYGEDLHESIWDKAAALMRSMSLNHPFVDGNKRTSLLLTTVFLMERGYGIREDVSEEEVVGFCIAVASGQKQHAEIASWLKSVSDRDSAKKAFKEIMYTLGSENEIL